MPKGNEIPLEGVWDTGLGLFLVFTLLPVYYMSRSEGMGWFCAVYV